MNDQRTIAIERNARRHVVACTAAGQSLRPLTSEGIIDRHQQALLAGSGLAGFAGALVTSNWRTARLAARVVWAPPNGRPGTGALAYRIEGSGLPATVLLHGLFASGRYWGASYDNLANTSTLLVPDLAGFGRSLQVADGFGPDVHADLVAQTMRELGLGEQPVLIGAHSLGCLIAIRLAARHPDLVAGLVAFSPPLYRDEESARRYLTQANILVRLFVASPSLSEAVCGWMCNHQSLAARVGRLVRPELPEPLAEDRLRHTYRSYSETIAKVIVAAGAAGAIGQVKIPLHLVAGERDSVLDHGFLAEIAQSHPHVRLSAWPRGEHELPLTHPTACVTALKEMRTVVNR